MAGFEELNARLEAATTGLAGVTRKRVFSRNTFFVDGKLFALVWREGRIGVKLPEGNAFSELEALSGASKWVAWGRLMNGWLLVPTGMHTDAAALASWVKRACEAVRAAAPSPTNEMAVTRVEPIPASRVPVVSEAPAMPPMPAPVITPSQKPAPLASKPVPPPLPAAARGASARPPIPVPVKAPSVPPPAAEEVAADDEFSFGDEPAAPVVAAPASEPAAAAAPEPAPSEPSPSEPEPEADAAEFSFGDEPAEPAAAKESQEFDFGGDEPPAAAPEPEPKKKGKGKGKKKTG